MKFTVKMIVSNYKSIKDEWMEVEVKKNFYCNNYDDLQNLLLTLIESSADTVRFEIDKEEVAD